MKERHPSLYQKERGIIKRRERQEDRGSFSVQKKNENKANEEGGMGTFSVTGKRRRLMTMAEEKGAR